MKKIAIIPARSGSKGLINKNILNLCGKPLMAWSIEAAQNSNCFEKIIVSTDSREYGEIAKKYGADVIYRSADLSNDQATTYMVIEDVLNKLEMNITYFVLLQPTSPMRNSIHIREACLKYEKSINDFDFLVSVREAEHSSLLVKPIDEDESLKFFDSDFSNYHRQLYREYSPNGAIFIAKPDEYFKKKHFFGAKSLAYKMNIFDSIDIDNWLDFELAKICMEKKLNER